MEYFIPFLFLVIFFVILDLKVIHKKPKAVNAGEAFVWSLFWICLALLFNVVVYFIYENGKEAALQFFTGYLLEKSLSLDNIFVISLIFSYYQIPLQYQQRVLTWGILTAAVLRGIMIYLGLALVHAFAWLLYLLGLFLLISGLRLLFYDKSEKITENRLIAVLSRFFPITRQIHQERFFVKENGVWKMTPLLLALLQIETADVIFAIDSIPAIFAITMDPFIVYTSNIFAILGLRALYFALASMIERFRYLKTSLALILAYVGFKMLIVDFYKIPNLWSLLIILSLLVFGILFSIRKIRS
jgi:TerC family integral membrane protein